MHPSPGLSHPAATIRTCHRTTTALPIRRLLDTAGNIVKVRLVEPEASRLWVDLQDGRSATITLAAYEDYAAGDVLFCQDGFTPEKVPDELWGKSTQVGTIRHVSGGRVIVDVDGSLKAYPQRSSLPFQAGQTVEIDSTGRPGRLLSERPVDRLGLADRDTIDVESLVVEPAGELTLEDFGGSPDIVNRAANLVRVALDPHNRIKEIGANPIKGMLFTGPPGTGKTHLAKVLAGLAGATFYNIAGPTIVDQWVGQSERALRSIFDHARRNAPAILFFDEIDSLFTRRGSSTHEATNRLVGQLLSLLDGFSAFEQVMVIATTNLPESLDNALLRPGRLSHKIQFTLPDTADRAAICEASSRHIKFSEPVDPHMLAEATPGWTSSDIAAIWTEAAILAALDGRVTLCLEDVHEGMQRVQRAPVAPEKDPES
ncbi:ATPase AAA [Nonomuraea sp. TT08I-71]|nr:ATPase AAA [Nonomuraea sp. TT08I-71]